MKRYMKIGASSCLDMIDAFNNKIEELDPGAVTGAEKIQAEDMSDMDYVQGAVDDAYIDEMMSYVADETAALDDPCVCTWDVADGKITFVLTSIEGDSVSEFSCPIEDLTGDMNADIDYVMSAINE